MTPVRRASRLGVQAQIAGLMLSLLAGVAHAWNDVSAGRDLPWLGKGGRARYYQQDYACIGCTTGYNHEERWGRSSFFGESPYDTVSKAMSFLDQTGYLTSAPTKQGSGTVYVETGLVNPRALPYHFTVVMIEPTVIVMNFDLGELVRGDIVPGGQIVGSARIDGVVSYGTQVPATGSLLWFCPEAAQAPIPVYGQSSGHGEIKVKGIALRLAKQGDTWTVERE